MGDLSRVEWGGSHDEATAAPVESEMSGDGLGQFLELGLQGYDLGTDILSSGLAAVEVGGVAGLGDLSRVEWGHAHDEAAAAPEETVELENMLAVSGPADLKALHRLAKQQFLLEVLPPLKEDVSIDLRWAVGIAYCLSVAGPVDLSESEGPAARLECIGEAAAKPNRSRRRGRQKRPQQAAANSDLPVSVPTEVVKHLEEAAVALPQAAAGEESHLEESLRVGQAEDVATSFLPSPLEPLSAAPNRRSRRAAALARESSSGALVGEGRVAGLGKGQPGTAAAAAKGAELAAAQALSGSLRRRQLELAVELAMARSASASTRADLVQSQVQSQLLELELAAARCEVIECVVESNGDLRLLCGEGASVVDVEAFLASDALLAGLCISDPG